MPITVDGLLGNARNARWARYRLRQNPFPSTGVNMPVEYDRPEISSRISGWLTETLNPSATVFPPLVLHGDIGVGKTHILHRIAGVVADYSEYTAKTGGTPWGIQQSALPDVSQGRLELSRLLLSVITGAPHGGLGDSGSPVPLLDTLANAIEMEPNALDVLAPSSAVKGAMRQVTLAKTRDRQWLIDIFGRWLLRNTPTGPQRSALGLPGPLSGEGQAILAYCDVLRLARATHSLQGQLFLLDQVEDLWRKDAITDARRARFLTDLRTLVDQCLTGAPVPLVLAWNTSPMGATRTTNSFFSENYFALWSRLANRVEITPLATEEVRRFAEEYVRYEERMFLAEGRRPLGKLSVLDELTPEVLNAVCQRAYDVQPTGAGLVVQRRVLASLRQWADTLVER